MAIKFGRPLESRVRFSPAEAPAPALKLDLAVRMRRNRRADWSRRLVRENVLTTDDLIWPLFVAEGENTRAPVASMPGVERLSVDLIAREAERAAALAIPCIALFPYTEPSLRDADGSEALNADNLVCRAVRAVKAAAPEIGILCDVPRTATIQATESLTTLKITKDLFYRMVADFPSISLEVMRVLAQRLEHMNEQLRDAVAAKS